MTPTEASELLSGRVLMASASLPESITPAQLAALSIPAGTVVTGACFACETPDSEPFPAGMAGVEFRKSNLDNVKLPTGNTATGCSQRKYRVNPADGEDWTIDADGNFVTPLGEEAA